MNYNRIITDYDESMSFDDVSNYEKDFGHTFDNISKDLSNVRFYYYSRPKEGFRRYSKVNYKDRGIRCKSTRPEYAPYNVYFKKFMKPSLTDNYYGYDGRVYGEALIPGIKNFNLRFDILHNCFKGRRIYDRVSKY